MVTDELHCIYLGMTKHRLHLWFGEKKLEGENSALEIRYMYMHIHDYSGTTENGLPILLEPPQCGGMAAVPNHSL